LARTQAVINRIYEQTAAKVSEIRQMAARRDKAIKRKQEEEAIISLLM
jgi:hypothetical protein